MRARLTVVAGNARPPICELQPDSIIRLGRKGSNHVVLSDQHASRVHAELYRDASGYWFVRDCPEITNPTRVDGRKIEAPTRLEHGQVIAIGEARLRFTQDPSTTSTESLPVLTDDPLSDSTTLQADELETLFSFMTASQNEPTAPGLDAPGTDCGAAANARIAVRLPESGCLRPIAGHRVAGPFLCGPAAEPPIDATGHRHRPPGLVVCPQRPILDHREPGLLPRRGLCASAGYPSGCR